MPQSRALFAWYYVSRTTHNVVITQLAPLRQGNYFARRHFDQRVYLTFLIAKGKSFRSPRQRNGLLVGGIVGNAFGE